MTDTQTHGRHAAGAEEGAAEVLRSEERAVVGTRRHAVERVRLERTVVEEERTITVTVRREQVRVVRESLDEEHADASGPAEGGTPWMTVSEEQPQITMVVVPVERVRLVVDRVAGEVTREIELAHEEIEVDRV